MHASYLISLRIAEADKPHITREKLILPAIKGTIKIMLGEEKSWNEVEFIPLFNNTVHRRINEMFQWTEEELIRRVNVT